MKKYGIGSVVAKNRKIIFVIALILLIPSFLGMVNTRVNYDMLKYLPKDMDTVKGQDILLDDFGKGAFSTIIIEGMEPKQIKSLESKIKKVDHVDSVIWYSDLADLSVPMEFLPDKYYDAFNHGDATMLAVFFDTGTSADETMDAVRDIRHIAGKSCYVTGMSALVTDLKDLCEKEEPVYVGLAVLFATIAMMIFMDSFVIPFIFLASIGMAILLNLGTNMLLGEISYVTKAISAVLQLGVTMDYSIFLWHSYEEFIAKEGREHREEAMAQAINETLTAVIGSSITTVAGFISLCFMSFTLGKDLGIVMAKGVIFGVIGCVTTLPSMILIFHKVIEKTMHRPVIKRMDKTAAVITAKPAVFIAIFVLVLFPAVHGYRGTNDIVYYDMGKVLPKEMDFVKANLKLKDDFHMASTHMILVDSRLDQKDKSNLMKDVKKVDGVNKVLGLSSVVGNAVPEEMIPEDIRSDFQNDRYELLVVGSKYYPASNKVNRQIEHIQKIIKGYDKSAMLIGEAPCTKDLIDVTDKDFKVVSLVSIAAIFVIIAIVLKSFTLPLILVAVIEFAISINLGIPYYFGKSLPFLAPICISTIQLGATVDYAILMTTRYKKERIVGNEKHKAVATAVSTSIPSIIVSAMGFFAATFGVSLYSDIDIIGSMCTLMARGALISMVSVIFILPSMLLVFDGLICRTTKNMKGCIERKGQEAV